MPGNNRQGAQPLPAAETRLQELLQKLSRVNISKRINDDLLQQVATEAAKEQSSNTLEEKTIEALVATHLSALYAVNERSISRRTDLRRLAQSTGALFRQLPLRDGSPFACRVAHALLDAGLLDCYARIAAWVRARGAQAAAAASNSAAPAAAYDEDELANHCAFVREACVMLGMLVEWTSCLDDPFPAHERLCAALERSQLLEHAAVALVTLAAACARVPPPRAAGVAGAAAPRGRGARGGSAGGGAANSRVLRDLQDKSNSLCISDGASQLLGVFAALALDCRLDSRLMAPHPHPGLVTALKPSVGSLQAAERMRRLLSGRGVQFFCVWEVEVARLAALGARGELHRNAGAVSATAAGSVGVGAPAAAAQPPAMPAALWLPPALTRPWQLEESGRRRTLSLLFSAARFAAIIGQLTSRGPYVLPTANPPAGSRPAGPCATAAPRAAGAAAAGAAAAGAEAEAGGPEQQLSALQAFDALALAASTLAECGNPLYEPSFAAGVLSRLLMELRPRQAAVRLPAHWRVVAMLLPEIRVRDLAAVADLLRLQLAGPDGSVLSCAGGGADAAPAGEVPVYRGPAYSLQCGLSAGLLPSLERLLRDEQALRRPGPASGSCPGLLSTVNLTLRYSGVWPALLTHASLTEAVGLVATLGSVARFFGAHNMGDMGPVALGGVVGRTQDWGGGGPRLAQGCYLAAMLEQCLDVRDPHQWRTLQQQQQREVGAPTAAPGTPLWFNNAMEERGQDPMQLGWLAAAGGAPPAGSAAAAQLDLLCSFALQDWLPPLVGSALSAVEPDYELRRGVAPGARATTPEPHLVLLVTQLLTRVAAQQVRLLVSPGPGAAREGAPATGREPTAGAASQAAPAAAAAAAGAPAAGTAVAEAEAEAAPAALPPATQQVRLLVAPGPGAACEGGPATVREPPDQTAAGAASQAAPAAAAAAAAGAAAAAAAAEAAPAALPPAASSWEQYLGPLYGAGGGAAELLFKLLNKLRDERGRSDSEDSGSEDERCTDEPLQRSTLQLLAALACTRPGLLVRWLAVELQSAVGADAAARQAPTEHRGAVAAAIDVDDHMGGVLRLLLRVARVHAMPELVRFIAAAEVGARQRLTPRTALFASGVKPGMAAWEVCSAAEEAAAAALAPAAAELAAAVRGSAWLQRLLDGQAWLLAPAEVQARLRAAGVVLPDTRLGAGGSGSGSAPRQGCAGSSGGGAGSSTSGGSGSGVADSGPLMKLCANPECSGLAGPGALIAPNSGKTCSRCRQLTYCCGACQLSHWREGHQTACAGAAAAAAAAGRDVQGKSGGGTYRR